VKFSLVRLSHDQMQRPQSVPWIDLYHDHANGLVIRRSNRKQVAPEIVETGNVGPKGVEPKGTRHVQAGGNSGIGEPIHAVTINFGWPKSADSAFFAGAINENGLGGRCRGQWIQTRTTLRHLRHAESHINEAHAI
jgi:hypothetical protein